MFARERCVKEIVRAIQAVEDGTTPIKIAVEYAFALGEECAREDAMHRACLGFSEARAHREALMRGFVT
jgi:hypothetical protein